MRITTQNYKGRSLIILKSFNSHNVCNITPKKSSDSYTVIRIKISCSLFKVRQSRLLSFIKCRLSWSTYWRDAGGKGTGSSSLTNSRQSKSREDLDFNPHSEDSMASSQNPSPTHEAVPSHVPIPVPPTNSLGEVLRRQNTFLDHLGIDLSVGQHQERLIDDRRCSPTQRHEERYKMKSTDFLPHLEYLIHIRAQCEDEYIERR